MKRGIARVILSRPFQLSMAASALRRFINATADFYDYSPQFLVDTQATKRPHYAYVMLTAADLARRLGHSKMSAIEFGVAGGNGLIFMESFAPAVEKATGVKIECYGFDTGEGMPQPQGPKDLPYWFQAEQYRMDKVALEERLDNAKLVIGNVVDTVGGFVEKYQPAPIGAIMNDLDYWSSTRDSFGLLASSRLLPAHFLPRIVMYFDDIVGREFEMCGPSNGQAAAIEEFNAAESDMKIHHNQNLLLNLHVKYRRQIYYAHLFGHPKYSTYIGGNQQVGMETALRLQ